MEETSLILDLAIAFGAALGGGVIARLLRQPALLGYLIAGIIIGPYALGLIQSTGNIQILATIGVVLLLFTLGIEYSFRELRRVRNVAIFGGVVQIVVTTALGVFVGISLLGLGLYEAIAFGFMLAVSSTMVVLGMLVDRGEANSVHGRVMIGILLVQDIAAAFAMFILPVLGTGNGSLLPALGVAFLNISHWYLGAPPSIKARSSTTVQGVIRNLGRGVRIRSCLCCLLLWSICSFRSLCHRSYGQSVGLRSSGAW